MRYRFHLVSHRSSCKAQIHGVMAKNGVLPPEGRCGAREGPLSSDALELPTGYAIRIDSLRDLIDIYDREVAVIDTYIHGGLKDHPGYRAVQQIDGDGKVIGAIFVAQIGDISRFDSPKKLCCWAGLAPKRRESDDEVHRGPITKQGCPLVRWAAIETVTEIERRPQLAADYHQNHREHQGRVQGTDGGGRKLLALVYYGLRDNEIRCLEAPEAA